MKNSVNNSEMRTEKWYDNAVSEAYASGNYETGLELEREAAITYGEDWRFMANIEEAIYAEKAPEAKIVARQVSEAKIDMVMGKLEQAESIEDWETKLAAESELSELVAVSLSEEYEWVMAVTNGETMAA